MIAASTQLNNLLYNKSYRVTSIARYYYYDATSYSAAYWIAYAEFDDITQPGTLSGPRYTNSAGNIYTADLKGGGTSNLRDYGSSVPLRPTIDVYNHNTRPLGSQPFSQVREVKFPYKNNQICPISTSC